MGKLGDMDLTPEARARISAANKGKPKSPEHRAKLSLANKGRVISPEIRARMSEARKGVLVLGDDVGYRAAHIRHRKALPSACAHCGVSTGRLECALRRDVPTHRIKVEESGQHAGLAYSPRTEDYIRLCTRCHFAHDGRSAMARKTMNRQGKPRPVPNRKKAATGGRKSSRKGVPNRKGKT